MRTVITNEAGQIKLGETVLPGAFQSMEISSKLRIDEKEVPGSSGKRKQPLGYEDASITITLILYTDDNLDCYDKAETLINLFQNVDKQAKPYVYSIVNRLLSKWKITEVLFEEIWISEGNEDDTLNANLSFTEYRPALVQAEAKAPTPTIKKSSAVISTSQGIADFRLMEDRQLSSYANTASAATAKDVQSPAIDDDVI